MATYKRYDRHGRYRGKTVRDDGDKNTGCLFMILALAFAWFIQRLLGF